MFVRVTRRSRRGYGLSSRVAQPAGERLCVYRRLPRSCRWSTCARGAQAHASSASAATHLVHREHHQAKRGQRRRLRCVRVSKRGYRRRSRHAWSCINAASTSSSGGSPSRRGMPGSGHANCERPASDMRFHAASRACDASAPCKLRCSGMRAPPAAQRRSTAGQRSAAGLRTLRVSASGRVGARRRAPDSLNCSRVCGRYQHASAKGECATSDTFAAAPSAHGAAQPARPEAAPSGCARR